MKGHSPILQSLAVAVAAFATIVVVLLFIPRYVADYQEPGGNGPNWRTQQVDADEAARVAFAAGLTVATAREQDAARAALAAGLAVAKAREADAFRRGWEEGYRLGREDWKQQ